MKYVNVQYNSITARVYDPSADPSGSAERKYALVFHGWMGHREDLRFLAEPFADLGYTIIVPDLPYHGDSMNAKVSSCFDAAKLLSDSLPGLLGEYRQSLYRVLIVGYSMGGRIAFELAVAAEKGDITSLQVDALVLISSAGPPSSENERGNCRQTSQLRSQKLLDKCFTSSEYEEWLRCSWYSAALWGKIREKPFFDQLVHDRVRSFNEQSRYGWARAAVHMCRSTMTCPPEPIESPVLYFFGTEDRKYQQMASELQQHCLELQCVPVEGAGHNIHLEFSHALISQIKGFVKDICKPSLKNPCFISDVRYTTYSLPLKRSMTVGGQYISKREGIIVALHSNNGKFGIGDICPLPGLHRETLDVCINDICKLKSQILDRNQLLQTGSLQDAFIFMDYIEQFSPVSRNGLEAAYIHLLSHLRDQAISSCLCSLATKYLAKEELFPLKAVSMNGVLPRSAPVENPQSSTASENQYRESVTNSSFKVMKLKVGACDDVIVDAEHVRHAAFAAKKLHKRIRLDANRAWTKTQYEQFQNALVDYVDHIEFIEEPLKTSEFLSEYLSSNKRAPGKMCIALDEAIHDSTFERIAELASSTLCCAFVLKPSVIGSLRCLLLLWSIAQKNGCEVVLSTVFDSGVGTAWTAILAGVLGSREQHHGLGTFSHFLSDVFTPSFGECCAEHGDQVSVFACEKYLLSVSNKLFDSR
ncbi:o-succinylbenzoate synthase [Gracilariopsis chorda]|uniref:O-succinylbenzoate synthase n=1 Tax=Gracilariopsis chorda TaxID=448386 RepID=A0A2V3IKF8_9FLOR|nr:o-succinylbenzoate synthase [Gracilariopsis chorda]|eukprot:PXF41610.1 o-succinylbenzoate synthase [Gracilariopsis chorda]